MAYARAGVARLEQALKPVAQGTKIVTAEACRWSAEAHAAHGAAITAGYRERQTDLVEAHEGSGRRSMAPASP